MSTVVECSLRKLSASRRTRAASRSARLALILGLFPLGVFGLGQSASAADSCREEGRFIGLDAGERQQPAATDTAAVLTNALPIMGYMFHQARVAGSHWA